MLALLIAVLRPETVSAVLPAPTVTVVPLITIVLPVDNAVVTALAPVSVGQLNFQSLEPTKTQVLYKSDNAVAVV